MAFKLICGMSCDVWLFFLDVMMIFYFLFSIGLANTASYRGQITLNLKVKINKLF